MRFQNSSFLRRFPLTFTHGGGSVNSNSNNSFSRCTCAISETSSSNCALFRTGAVGLPCLTGLAGDVPISWGKAGSTEDIFGARPNAGTVSCSVVYYVVFKPCYLVSLWIPSQKWVPFINMHNGRVNDVTYCGNLGFFHTNEVSWCKRSRDLTVKN